MMLFNNNKNPRRPKGEKRAEENRKKGAIRWELRRKIGKENYVNPKRVVLTSKIEEGVETEYVIRAPKEQK